MKRRQAREIIIQCLYQMELNEVDSSTAIDSITTEQDDNDMNNLQNIKSEELKFIQELVDGTFQKKKEIDLVINDYLKGWKLERLSKVDIQVLRLASFEMFYINDAPPKVIVNEAIELSKHFGTEESGKFINGVLGKMIKELDTVKAKIRSF
ncbi:transcription antitermination factor NusB [Chengkuizengella axinellae]|uniref:Transcription antitermination protein NusB n=1 Tax=Chengkuizengella axinellae TaxID=3064388 RepID=A0ABT9IW58_9BACL|nr:transcription antitermination factor NusB [Chengkuizengella sp. 2205SS18-9]MDP5273604.1 transcription antitermination factor NusB [Chengkuizengella sp. 2205SS18-9]